MGKTKIYTNKELKIIAGALNSIQKTKCNDGVPKFCVNTYRHFYSKTHYIDYNERLEKFKVYVKYKGWTIN